MVEFALTLPIFAAVLLAMVDFSNYLNDRTVMTAAAYNGAKAADGRGAACGSNAGVQKAVRETADGMLSVDKKPTVESVDKKTSGVDRVVVVIQLQRPASLTSLFTSSLSAFNTIEARGVALCQE